MPDQRLKATNNIMSFINNFRDYFKGLSEVTAWSYMAIFDTKARYKRTLLGPLWTTINGIIFIALYSFVFPRLFKASIDDVIAFIAAGYFVWSMISIAITELSTVLWGYGDVIKLTSMSPNTLFMRALLRNLIVFLHHLVSYYCVVFFFGIYPTHFFIVLLTIIPVAAFIFGLGQVFAFINLRFRDVEQLLASLILALFFFTPILWPPSMIDPDMAVNLPWYILYNPFYYMIEIMRDPMLGKMPSIKYLIIACAISVVSLIMGFIAYALHRHRVAVLA